MSSTLSQAGVFGPTYRSGNASAVKCLLRRLLVILALGIAPYLARAAPVEAQLFDRIDELRRLHDDLFYRIEAELLLPYRLLPYERERWNVQELVEVIDNEQWAVEERQAVVQLLDAAVLERRSGYFRLDEEARLIVKYRPRALTDAIRSRNVIELWSEDPDSRQDWSGAKTYLRARTRLASAGLGGAPIAEQKSRWLAELRDFSFLTGSAQFGYRQLLASEFEAAQTKMPLSTEHRQKLEEMREIQKTWRPKSLPGPGLASMADLGHQGIAKLLATRKPSAPSLRSFQTMTEDLNRLARILGALQGAAERARLGTFRIEIRSPTGEAGKGSSWHDPNLRFFGMRDENEVGIIEAEPAAVFAGYATCAFQSQVARAWDLRRMLDPDLPTVEKLWQQGRGGRMIEPDYYKNPIFNLAVNWSGDNLTPLYPLPKEDAIDATRRMLHGFDLCVSRYFAFVISHELAHLYLPPTGKASVSTDEIAADCEALRTIERLRKQETETGRRPPEFQTAEGFMRHLLEGSTELSRAVAGQGFDVVKFQKRYALLEQAKSCAAQ